MSDSLRFTLEMVDRVAGPAKAIQSSLKGVDASLKGINMAGFGRSMGDAGAKGVQWFGERIPGAMKLAAEAAIAAETALIGAAIAGGKWAIDQIAGIDNARFALEKITGSADAAGAAMKDVGTLANILGTDPGEISKQLTLLVNKGHDVATSFKIIEGAADLQRLGGDAKMLVDAFAQIDGKVKLSARSVSSLIEAGVDAEKLKAILGNDFEAKIASGVIDAATLQAAALQAITEKTGKVLGATAEEWSKTTVGGSIERLKSLPARLLASMDPALFAKITDQIEKAFGKVEEVLSSPAIKQAMETLVGSMGEALPQIASALADVFTPGNILAATTFAQAMLEVAKAVGGEALKSFIAMLGPLRDLINLSDHNSEQLKKLHRGFEIIGKVVGFVAGALVYGVVALVSFAAVLAETAEEIYNAFGGDGTAMAVIDFFAVSIPNAVGSAWTAVKGAWGSIVGAFTSAWEAVKGAWTSVTTWFGTVVADATTFGTNIVDGIENGIKAAWRGLIATFEGLLKLLPSAVKDILGISSPSKVMMELGGYTAKGFNVGLERGASPTADLFADMVRPPQFAMTPAPVSRSMGDINITINAGPGTDGSEIAAQVRREIVGFFEGV